MVQKRMVLCALVVMCSVSELVEASTIVRLLPPVVVSMRPTSLALVHRTVQEVHPDVQKMRDEKLKAMSTLLSERMYIELGRYSSEKSEDEQFSDAEYYALGIDFIERAVDVFPDLRKHISHDHCERLGILKSYCDNSCERDFEREKSCVELLVPQVVEKILAWITSQKNNC